MKKRTLLTISIFLLWNATVHALNSTPETCPSINAIKAVALQMALKDERGSGYSTFAVDNYGTAYKWNFVISKIEANSTSEAMEKGQEALQTLSGNPPPLSYGDLWFCIYIIDNGYNAVAFEPSFFYAKDAINIAHKLTN